MLYCRGSKRCPWGNGVKGMWDLCIISFKCLWIYNFLKTKSLIKQTNKTNKPSVTSDGPRKKLRVLCIAHKTLPNLALADLSCYNPSFKPQKNGASCPPCLCIWGFPLLEIFCSLFGAKRSKWCPHYRLWSLNDLGLYPSSSTSRPVYLTSLSLNLLMCKMGPMIPVLQGYCKDLYEMVRDLQHWTHRHWTVPDI